MVADDLAKLEAVLSRAERVGRLCDQWALRATRNTDVFLRHDVDGNNQSLKSSVAMARWEYDRGYKSTYYFLHGTRYWGTPAFVEALHDIGGMGHEIGFHNNALAEARRNSRDPFSILAEALGELREWAQPWAVTSTAAHGDADCRYGTFSNYQLFQESYSPYVLDNFMSAAQLGITPQPLAAWGFDFQGDWLPRPHYLTDSGGSWASYARLGYVTDLDGAVREFPWDEGHLSILQHPDWWPVALYA